MALFYTLLYWKSRNQLAIGKNCDRSRFGRCPPLCYDGLRLCAFNLYQDLHMPPLVGIRYLVSRVSRLAGAPWARVSYLVYPVRPESL